MCHTGGLLRRAVSMGVQLDTYGLEARFWITSGLPTIRELSRLAFEARRQMRSVLRLARGRTFLENCTSNGRAVWVRRHNFPVGVQYRQEYGGDGEFPLNFPARNRSLAHDRYRVDLCFWSLFRH